MSPSPGGWVLRRIDEWLASEADQTELVLAHQQAERTAAQASELATLRLPLLDVLGYARDWRAEHGEAAVRARLYHLLNEH